jgi:hypothetical protein
MTANADNREALFKLGRPALQTLNGRLPHMHQHNWRSGTGSWVGNGCAVGLQPTHGASSRRTVSN